VNIYGLETELQWSPRTDWTLFTNYTFNISKVSKDRENADLEGNDLPNDPRHSFHFGVRYRNPRIVNASLTASVYADIFYDNENTLRTGEYWTVDASVSRTFFDLATVYVSAENIFDKKYPIFLSPSYGDTIAPGAIVIGGIRFDF